MSSQEIEDVDVLLAMVPPAIPVTVDSALDVTGDPSVTYWSSPDLPDFDDRETEVKISASSFPSAPASSVAPAPASSAAPISLLPPINPPPRRDGAPAPSLAPVAMPSVPPAAATPMRARSKSIVIIHGRPSVLWSCGLLAAGALAAAAMAFVLNAREQGGLRSTASAAAALTFEQPTPHAGHLRAATHAPTPSDDADAAPDEKASSADAAKGKVASAPRVAPSSHATSHVAPRAPAVAAKPAPAPTHAAVAAAPPPAKPAAAPAAPAPVARGAAKPMSPEDADALAREQLKAALR